MDAERTRLLEPTRLDRWAATTANWLPGWMRPHIDQARRDAKIVGAQLRGKPRRPYLNGRVTPWRDAPLESLDRKTKRTRRFDQLRRDGHMIADRILYGRGPSPTVDRIGPAQRSPARHQTPVVSLPQTPKALSRDVHITRVVRETEHAVSIYLTETDGSPIVFTPGQFLTVEVELEGERLRRAYSIASYSNPADPTHVTVKRVEGGRVSNWLNDQAEPGQTLRILGPSGSFVIHPSSLQARRFVMIAGGSGITPIMSMIHSVILDEKDSKIWLIYGNRSPKDTIFRERIDALHRDYPERLFVTHAWESCNAEDSTPLGRLDERTTASLLQRPPMPLDEETRFYICGPSPMMDAARDALTARDIPKTRIFEERFSSPEVRTGARGSERIETVTFRARGQERAVRVQPGQTILEAASATDADLPFSCAMGGCGACKMKCVDGSVAMEEPNCLTDNEREQGYVLTCVGRPMGPVTLEGSQ